MQARGIYKVGANEVRFTVGNRTLHYGAAAHQLDPYRGRDVFITLDGDDLSRCFAFTADRHDETGCLVLLAGKPPIYEKLGFRRVGDYSEVTDQLAARIVIRRDLTLRTRTGKNPQPLFSLEDIRKLIAQA